MRIDFDATDKTITDAKQVISLLRGIADVIEVFNNHEGFDVTEVAEGFCLSVNDPCDPLIGLDADFYFDPVSQNINEGN